MVIKGKYVFFLSQKDCLDRGTFERRNFQTERQWKSHEKVTEISAAFVLVTLPVRHK
jgi:hypothetical protein